MLGSVEQFLVPQTTSREGLGRLCSTKAGLNQQCPIRFAMEKDEQKEFPGMSWTVEENGQTILKVSGWTIDLRVTNHPDWLALSQVQGNQNDWSPFPCSRNEFSQVNHMIEQGDHGVEDTSESMVVVMDSDSKPPGKGGIVSRGKVEGIRDQRSR